ncbi:MAG TPA: tetratricopeptide repeat protein, partial [Pyrinomonadaceae bacterium]|nr:tetratricopeptide repeat protein [Pyrinomonadaceae bacterium]
MLERFKSYSKQPRKLCVGAVIVLLFAATPILQAQTTGDVNLERLAQAINAIGENRLPDAEKLLNSVLAAMPNDADALNLLGVVRAKQDRSTEAARLFKRALERSPSHLGAHINLGELLLTSNRPSEALPILRRAHTLAPNRPEINLNLARLYAEKANYEEAYRFLRLVPREAFSDDYFPLLLRALIGLSRKDEVLTVVRDFRESGSATVETQVEFALVPKTSVNLILPKLIHPLPRGGTDPAQIRSYFSGKPVKPALHETSTSVVLRSLLRRSNMFIATRYLIDSAPLGAECKLSPQKHIALRWSA